MRRLTTINYNNRNCSWLLDPNRPLEPPRVILKVVVSGKIQSSSKPEEPARESRDSGHMVLTKGKRAHA